MNLHEFESKKILFKYNFNILNSYLTKKKIFLKNYVYKIQVHSNYRKKNFGIIITNKKEVICNFFKYWKLNVFFKKKINIFLIEKKIQIEKEFYISFSFLNEILIFTLSNKGGIEVEIQKKINFIKINFKICVIIFSIIDYLLNCNVKISIILLLINLIIKIFKLIFIKKIQLLEINPVCLYKKQFYIIDCKIIIEKNNYLNFSDKISNILKINLVNLNGKIFSIVNGAGLALKTLDVLSLNNLNCLYFTDLSGSVTEKNINFLIKFILINKKIKLLLINLFGGIVSCKKILTSILNLTYYNFKFKILIKLDGLDSKFVINNLVKFKNVIIVDEETYLDKCKFYLNV